MARVQEIPTASFAKLSYAMTSPFRCRLVANLVRGKSLEEASRLLILEKKKAAKIIYKLLRSATSNAEQKGVADIERLYISEIRVDEAPRIKRWMSRSQGRADQRITRTSHISIKLSEKAGPTKKSNKPAGAKAKAEPKATKKTKTTPKKGNEE